MNTDQKRLVRTKIAALEGSLVELGLQRVAVQRQLIAYGLDEIAKLYGSNVAESYAASCWRALQSDKESGGPLTAQQ